MTASPYRIKDVADRSGFSAAALRYYEDIGLLPPPERTAAGYRLYDDATLDRLAFISRAKQLGCSLDEIGDLATIWDDGRCGPVQDRMRTVVADKLLAAQHKISELTDFACQLREAAIALSGERPDGPCDDTCGCVEVRGPTESDEQLFGLIAKPAATREATAPIACTLDATAYHERIQAWQAILQHVAQRAFVADGARLVFDATVPLDELAQLVAAERACCAFMSFAITVDDRGVGLEVTTPTGGRDLVHELFGAPA